MQPDASFFRRFDALATEASVLQGAKASLDAATAARDRVRSQLSTSQAALAKNQSYAQEQRDRIELVSSHWFYGTTALQPQLWFRGGTEGKIGRAKAKLTHCETEYPSLVATVATMEQQTLPRLQAAVDQHTHTYARSQAVDAEMSSMRESAVAAHPSPTLTQLRGEETALAQQVSLGAQNAHSLTNIGKQCVDGRRHFERAAWLTRNAQALNRAAAAEHTSHHHHNHNHQSSGRACAGGCGLRVTWHHSHCCGACERHPHQHGPRCDHQPFHAHHHDTVAERHAAQQRERAEQAMRDRKMREAQAEADRGADLLRRAFGALPTAVRERYPAQCAAFAAVEVPQLAQNHAGTRMLEFFGGAGGNLLAEWQSGDKLRQNLAVIQRCEVVATQQERIIRELEAQLRRDSDAAAQQKGRVAKAIEAEKLRIFDELRTRATGGVPTPATMPPTPMAHMPTLHSVGQPVAQTSDVTQSVVIGAPVVPQPFFDSQDVQPPYASSAPMAYPVAQQPAPVGGSDTVPMGIPIQ